MRSLLKIDHETITRIVTGMDAGSGKIVWFLYEHRYAGIDALAKLIEAPTHMDVLFKIREIINPMAENITGCPILSFERSRVDGVTGKKVTFSWWLNGQPASDRQEPLLDIFDEGAVLIVYVELFGVEEDKLRLSVTGNRLIIDADQNYHKEILLSSKVDVKSISTKFNNNLLEVRLTKATVPTM